MKKTVVRSMTARELRHFLERFEEGVRLKAICTDDELSEPGDLPYTAGELLGLLAEKDDEEPVTLVSPLGQGGVRGFLIANPPALFVGLCSTSIQSN